MRVCFMCGRKLGRNPTLVTCRDEQGVFIGSECVKFVTRAGVKGFQPLNGGPRLFLLRHDPKGAPTFAQVGARLDAARRPR